MNTIPVRRIILILSCPCWIFALAGATGCSTARADDALVATSAKKPPLRVVVDPRVELMSIIFRLAGNPEYGRGMVDSYTKDVEKHFGEFRTHPAVKLAQKLRVEHGVSYDACMSMAVHLKGVDKCEERVPLDPRPDGLDARWSADGAREFLSALRQFVQDAKFDEFVVDHRSLYETTESRMKELLEKEAHLEWFDGFFGGNKKVDFTVALGLLNGGQCYGPHFSGADGQTEFYCVLGVWKTDKDGLPTFDRSMLETVVHEFCHSYANSIIDRHEKDFKSAGEKIFSQVEAAMGRQAYGNWKTMMYESLVRASTLCYIRRYNGNIAYYDALNDQKNRKFLWAGELADLLGAYEKQRDRYPDLDAFAPKIVEFFNDYAEKFEKRRKLDAANTPKVVSMTPSNGATDVDPALTQIRVTFDRPMQYHSWSLVGGGPNFPEMEGNPSYNDDRTVWTVKVKLKPGWNYEFMLNSDRFQNFKSAKGVPLEPVEVKFKTK